MNFQAELQLKVQMVEEMLNVCVPASGVYPEVIHAAMRYSLLGGGKRLRPVLVLAAAEVVGGEPRRVLRAACAIELIHTYSLIHDDLPAMDNDDLRRGRPTCHRAYGEAVAILAGDALLTLAFEQLAACAVMDGLPAEKVVQVIHEIAVAAGTAGLIGGQVVDTLLTGKQTDPATLEYIHRCKTGALYRVAVRTGALLADAKAEELAALTTFSEHLGLAFQIQDDILDVTGTAEVLGKTPGRDQELQKNTYPALFGLEAARARAQAEIEAAKSSLQIFGERARFLCALADFIIERDR